MYDVTHDNAADFNFVASDGTALTFSKVTSKGNIQVKFPDDHDLADDQGNGLIFRRDGSHFKDAIDLTVSATRKAAPTPAPMVQDSTGIRSGGGNVEQPFQLDRPAIDLAPKPAPVTNPFDKYSDSQLDGLKIVIRGKLYTLEADTDYDDVLVLAA